MIHLSPALLLNEATRGSGDDGAATEGSWETELDLVVSTLWSSQRGRHCMKHRHRGREDGVLEGESGRAEERSSYISDSSRWPIAMAGHWSLGLLRSEA